MKRKLNARVVAGAVAGLAVAGGGAAIAADQLRSPKEQGAAIKKRIESGDFQLFGGPGLGPGFHHGPFPGFGFFGGLDAAATYLGLTRTQLESRLNDGKTLAEIAKAQDKSVDGLVNAMYDAAKQKLDDAVSAGRLTKSEEQRVLADLKSRLTDFVNNAQLRLHRDRDGDHDFRGGPPEGVPFGLPGV